MTEAPICPDAPLIEGHVLVHAAAGSGRVGPFAITQVDPAGVRPVIRTINLAAAVAKVVMEQAFCLQPPPQPESAVFPSGTTLGFSLPTARSGAHRNYRRLASIRRQSPTLFPWA